MFSQICTKGYVFYQSVMFHNDYWASQHRISRINLILYLEHHQPLVCNSLRIPSPLMTMLILYWTSKCIYIGLKYHLHLQHTCTIKKCISQKQLLACRNLTEISCFFETCKGVFPVGEVMHLGLFDLWEGSTAYVWKEGPLSIYIASWCTFLGFLKG